MMSNTLCKQLDLQNGKNSPPTSYTDPSKRNSTLGSGAPTTPVQGQRSQWVKRSLARVPLLTTFCPYGVVDPKLGSWEHLDQVLRFFWRGVYVQTNSLKHIHFKITYTQMLSVCLCFFFFFFFFSFPFFFFFSPFRFNI